MQSIGHDINGKVAHNPFVYIVPYVCQGADHLKALAIVRLTLLLLFHANTLQFDFYGPIVIVSPNRIRNY